MWFEFQEQLAQWKRQAIIYTSEIHRIQEDSEGWNVELTTMTYELTEIVLPEVQPTMPIDIFAKAPKQ